MKWHEFAKERPQESGEYLILINLGKWIPKDPLPYGCVDIARYHVSGERVTYTNASHYPDLTPEERLQRIIFNPDYWISPGAFYRRDTEDEPRLVYSITHWAKLPRLPLEYQGNQNEWTDRAEEF